MKSLELHKLNPSSHTELYNIATTSYTKIYNNIMSKGKEEVATPKFLGGNPVTLEKQDFATLAKHPYMVSAKANGLRYLLLVGEKSLEDGGRHIFLVDKDVEFWVVRYDGILLPTIQGTSQLLLDGELLMWGRIVNRTTDLVQLYPYSNHNPHFLYSTFDILYGPSTPTFAGESANLKMDLGASFPMMGPKGGSRWPFYKRYNILTTLVTNKFSSLWAFNTILQNKDYPFGIVLSPFVQLGDLLRMPNLGNPTKMYNHMVSLFQKSIKEQCPTIPPIPKKNPHGRDLLANGQTTDGLVFTRFDTEYIRGAWDFCGNKTLKWKPIEDLTIDLLARKQISPGVWEVGVMGDGKILGYRIGDKVAEIHNKTKIPGVVTGGIVECIWEIGSNIFVPIGLRLDKTKPNHIQTVASVLRSHIDPIDLSLLRQLFIYGLANMVKRASKPPIPKFITKIVDQLGIRHRMRCLVSQNPILVFGKETLLGIANFIDKYRNDPNVEIESRLHFPKNYLPYFSCILGKSHRLDMSQLVESVKLYGKGGTRQTYALLGKYKILAESTKKTPISKLAIPESQAMGLAQYRFASLDMHASQEIDTDLKIKKPTYHRYQIELKGLPRDINPSVLWRLDMSVYGDSKKSLESAKYNFLNNPKCQIELEYSPGYQEYEAWGYYTHNPHPQILLDIAKSFRLPTTNPTPETVLQELNNRIAKLKNQSTNTIVRDYCRLVCYICTRIYE